MHRLIVPGLFEPPDAGSLPDTPLLDHLVGRGELTREGAVGYERLLAACFGLGSHDEEIPTGALLADQLLDSGAEGHWACVAPVHLHIDRDRMLLFPVETERVDAGRILGRLNDHFSEDGLGFLATPEGPWLMRLESPRSVRTCAIDEVAARSLDPFMPTGDDAGWLHSIMNECQMLLHQEAAGETFNSLWFWGFGSLPELTRRPLELVSGARLPKALMESLAPDASPGDSSLFVTEQCLEGRHYGDMRRWISGVSETEKRLRELLELRGEELQLQSDNGFSVRYRSPMRFRFWQSGSFSDLVQREESPG